MSMEKRIQKLEAENKPRMIRTWLDLVQSANEDSDKSEPVEISDEWLPIIESARKRRDELEEQNEES